MKKLSFLKKLSKTEQKNITAGTGKTGGSNNPGTGGNDPCGSQPEVCFSPEWYTWYNCKLTYYGTQPITQCQ